jgi:hypothetical protein
MLKIVPPKVSGKFCMQCGRPVRKVGKIVVSHYSFWDGTPRKMFIRICCSHPWAWWSGSHTDEQWFYDVESKACNDPNGNKYWVDGYDSDSQRMEQMDKLEQFIETGKENKREDRS